jgi:hypothetical protein
MRSAALRTESMDTTPQKTSHGWGRAAMALAAGLVTQLCFYYFWQLVGRSLVGPMVLPFGRGPDDVVGLVLPFLGGLVAASYHRQGWWWIGQVMALPAFGGMHLLFAAAIEMAYSRPPTLQEEGRFFLAEGHRLLAGFLGSYLGALLQND